LSQNVSNQEKEKPRNKYTEHALNESDHAAERSRLFARRSRDGLQARGAENAIVILCDAFATEKFCALEATRDRFTCGVIETTLMGQITHTQGTCCSCAAMIAGRMRSKIRRVRRTRFKEGSTSIWTAVRR